MAKRFNLSPFLHESCEELSRKFYALKSPRGISELLHVPYEYLVYYLYQMPQSSKYTSFDVLKKSGGVRTIYRPSNSLRIVQRKLSQVLYAVYQPRPCVHGFAASRSIITNAKAHVRKKFVLNVDIKDFFDSINFGRVRGVFMANPYKLDAKTATVLAQICCFKNKLPQGAPSSPIVSNLVCMKLDSELQRFSKKYKLFYTRYADDITLSSNRKELPMELVASYQECKKVVTLGDEFRLIIEDNGFQLNRSKVRLAYQTQRQEVTGLIVNKFVNVNRKYIRNLDGALHAWEKYGLEAAEVTYLEKYAKETTLPEKEPPDFLSSLRGKIEFVGSVRGKDSHIYQRMLGKFTALLKQS